MLGAHDIHAFLSRYYVDFSKQKSKSDEDTRGERKMKYYVMEAAVSARPLGEGSGAVFRPRHAIPTAVEGTPTSLFI